MIQEARSLYPDKVFQVTGMQEISHINDQFDAIIFLASFHHLESKDERIQVLRDSKRLLNPNGKIYMTNWNLLEQERYRASHQ